MKELILFILVGLFLIKPRLQGVYIRSDRRGKY
ncbi:hypothetical protein I580_01035 [Enterococcus caccae ATCC BAA-1240]|uniref:Uncharacterized protein n=1 Tax=Enterococcus caccae ATCC BAA-1240 TaxID=1158612 RepID=R3W9U4_9ENTE|nr:hypothetical protein UC7_02276 [Enterococcus caccae ATCC BAA-1240]EOT68652.1 hypothetical protein I580_01035 [Enterococcus caccae ATCC BAA-1240]